MMGTIVSGVRPLAAAAAALALAGALLPASTAAANGSRLQVAQGRLPAAQYLAMTRSGAPEREPMMPPLVRAQEISTRPAPANVTVPSFTNALPAAALQAAAAYPLMSHDSGVAALGGGQSVEPPDTMVVAGSNVLLEAVNSNLSIWTKTGTRQAIFDLNAPLPAGYYFTDPWLLYDAPSGRFFFSGLAFNAAYASFVFVGASVSSDPSQGFYFYKLADNTSLHDQPKVGVSDDKLIVAWNDFCCGSALPVYRGSEIWALQKSAMLTGSALAYAATGPSGTLLSPVPAQALGATTTAYAAVNRTNAAGVIAITGTPAEANVSFTDTSVAMPGDSAPPKALQPGGRITTNDSRFLSAVWQDGDLWVAGNEACIPTGSFLRRACMRVIDVATSPSLSLVRSLDLGSRGVDMYYPALTLDAAGDVFLAFSASSSNVYASAVAAEMPAGTFQVSGAAMIEPGAKYYGGGRWGDYSSASVDPSDGSVWTAAEYSASGSSVNWATAVARFVP